MGDGSPGGQMLRKKVEAALSAGHLAAARALCDERLAADPRDASASRCLALISHFDGEPLAAMRAAAKACELAPRDARNWVELGRIEALQGRFAQAARSFDVALRCDPRHADAWHNLGLAWRRLGQREDAFAALRRALTIDSARADTWLALGTSLAENRQFDDAVECFERAARLDASLTRARSRLAHHMSARGRVIRAESLYRESLGLDPHHLPGWLGLGRCLEDMGQSEGARACYRNVLAREPRHPVALGQLLPLIEGESDSDAIERARAALGDAATSGESRALIGYGLAKYHDRRRDYDAAARAGLSANAARRRVAGPLDRDALAARVDSIIATCTRDYFAARRDFGLGTDQPVFIVGLPRSGTTLTEQILSQHPLVHGAGELPDMARIASLCAGDEAAPCQAVLGLDSTASRERAEEYLGALRAGAPRGVARIIDKSPLNFFHLGLIALLFPNARIVHCRRGARDNALSIWMENFNASQTYATDFDDLAFYISQYRRLMAHWREHLPLGMFECRYEETTADLEMRARALVDFMGLPWDSRCLDFHASARAVQTPSRWQVRQPVYRTSVARWKNYEASLPQLMQSICADD